MKSVTSIPTRPGIIDFVWIGREEPKSLLAFERVSGALVYWLIDYHLYMATNLSLSYKTANNEILYVKRFLEFARLRPTEVSDINDQLIKSFRDSEFDRCLSKTNRSGSEQATKRTVNAKLRRIYLFLEWLQTVEKCDRFLIGSSGCRVLSTLAPKNDASSKYGNSGYRHGTDRDRFPLIYRRVGEGSVHRTKYIATDKDVTNLVQYFLKRYSIALANRNILILELANRVGLRRASINSLRCAQFSRDLLDAKDCDPIVVPDSQKFGYEVAYEIPFRLAYRICDFIEQTREDVIKARGWGEAQTDGRVFFSFSSGEPLQDRTISQIFREAMAHLGINEHGANVHSLRRKKANDGIDKEIRTRRAFGLDTSVSSIAASVSMTLGQTNPDSLNPYISKLQGRFRDGDGLTDSERIAELELENQALKIKLLENEVGSQNIIKRVFKKTKK